MHSHLESPSRHQCLIYEGSPSRQLHALAAVIREKLGENMRCLYLDSPVMIAGIRCYLAAAGIDIVREIEENNLMLSSGQQHLIEGRFDIDHMLRSLEESCEQAHSDGYAGFWASGDMTWEFGPDKDFSKLLEYEWRLEEFIRTHPRFSGICQYHADSIPKQVLRQGLVAHSSVFVNQTLSRINPHYLRRESYSDQLLLNPELEQMIHQLCVCAEAS